MRKTVIFCILIAAVGLAAYSNTFNVPFVFDDLNIDTGIVLNPVIKDLQNFTASLKGYDFNPRRFIGYLTFALNYHFGGLDVTGYHIVNLAIHIFNAFFLYFLVNLTFRTPYFKRETLDVKRETSGTQDLESENDSRLTIHDSLSVDYSRFTIHPSHLIALFTSLFFVAHPVQTQAVTYIIQRSTSLATMFYLLSVVMYVRGRLSGRQADKPESWQADKPTSLQTFKLASLQAGKLASFFLSLLFAVLAMMTKEIAFTLPFIIVLYEFSFFQSTLKKKLLFLLPITLTMMIIPLSLINTHRSLGDIFSDLSKVTRISTDISRWDYLLTQLRVIVTYIRLLFFPINQNIDYDYPVYHSFFSRPVFLSFMLLAALFGTAVYLLYRSRQANRHSSGLADKLSSLQADKLPAAYLRLIAFGIFWFFITLSVESSFIPIADLIFEHRLYLPSVGAFLAISASIVCLTSVRKTDLRVITVVLSIVVVLFAGMTYRRNLVWKDPVSLWKETVRKSPYKARPLYNLGIVYENRGENENAAAFYNYAASARPGYFEALTRLGYIYYKMGNIALAERELKRAISVNPDYAYAYSYMGELYAKKGDYGKSIEFFRYATYLKDDAEFYNNLGTVFLKIGYFNDAVEALKTAIAVNPNYSKSYITLGEAYQNQSDYPRAIKVFKEALEKEPDNGLFRANLCQAYYRSGDLAAARKEYLLLIKSAPPEVISLISFAEELVSQ